jgi:predicted amidophosphoribosyltransferase
VIAVPGSRRARRRRGFDPVAALVAGAGLDRARVFPPARPHAAQKSLSIDERAQNLDGVFEVAAPVAGRRFLLVDDVVTTGATLAAAAAALRSAGAEVVAAAVVASTPKLYGPSVAPPRERPAAFP